MQNDMLFNIGVNGAAGSLALNYAGYAWGLTPDSTINPLNRIQNTYGAYAI